MGEILEFIKMASEGKPYQSNGIGGKVMDKPKPWEMQYELSKETENWNGCYPDPNLGHGENWESEEE